MATRKAGSKPIIHKFAGEKFTVCLIVSQWHKDITGKLLKGAMEVFEKIKMNKSSIKILQVPGSYELPMGAKWATNLYSPDAVICLGCIIRGETPHFNYISQAVANGIMELNLSNNIPVIFGVLTTDTAKQAKQRSGGKHRNKGAEAATAALKMIELRNKLNDEYAAKL